jgi:signal transduction histidine kinase
VLPDPPPTETADVPASVTDPEPEAADTPVTVDLTKRSPGPDEPDGSPLGAATDAVAESQEPLPLLALGATTWKRVAFALLNLPLGIAGFVCLAVFLSVGSGLAVTLLGLPLLAVGLIVFRALGRVERARARAMLGLRIESPSTVPVPHGGGFVGWTLARLSDPVGWRAALYLLIRLPWGIVTFTVTVALLVVLWPVLPYVVRAFAAVDRGLVTALLSPSGAMERRVRELEERRETMVDAAAADRRRIERDLHDGAQARLVALAMDLGLARERMSADPEAAARMVEQAHGEVKVALEELRALARGIHPAILTERGLGAALANIAGRCAVPVTVEVDLAERPSAALEGLLYFCAAELLTNISKHSAARTAHVRLARDGDAVELTVIDDGHGGAVAAPGGGLAGLTERVSAMDGVFTMSSPAGGPTVVTVRLR